MSKSNRTRKLSPPEEKEVALSEYIPTSKEFETVDAYLAIFREKPSVPRIKVTDQKGGAALSLDHPDHAIGQVLLMKALATTESEFMSGLISQLYSAGGQELNFMLSVIKGVEPKDQMETMLAAQMAAVHIAVMTFAHRLAHAENIPRQDSAVRAFNKLARTFTAQMEALTRYRGRGQQKMTVEHVHVHEGGQAIVGNVNQGPKGGREGE